MRTSFARNVSLSTRALLNIIWKKPICVSFEITHSCNASCKHCHLGGPANENRASPEKFAERVRELRPIVAQLSGGEPLIRQDLEQIVQAIRRPNKAPYIVITTNGVLLTKEKFQSLRQAGVDEFSLSLDYPDERHDEFRGIPGLFKRLENLVKSLPQEEKIAITLCCVVQSDNFRDLVRMAELAKEWGVKLNFSTYTNLRTNDPDFMLSEGQLEEFEEIIQRLLDFKKKYGVVLTSKYIFNKMIEFFSDGQMPHCRTGEKFFNVNPDGTLSPCGLIITDYKSQKELVEEFSKNNTCVYCYTSLRANTEKPIYHQIRDSKKSVS